LVQFISDVLFVNRNSVLGDCSESSTARDTTSDCYRSRSAVATCSPDRFRTNSRKRLPSYLSIKWCFSRLALAAV